MVSVTGYLTKLLCPVNLSVFYPLPRHFSAIQIFSSATALVVLSLLAWFARRQHRCLLMGWLWFLGMLVPVIGLIQVGDQAMADRYTYLPAVGLFVAVVFWMAQTRERFNRQARTLALITTVVLGACVVVTEHQLYFWRNSETLFNHALAVTQNNGPAAMMLGIAYEKQGRADEAREKYHQALEEDDSLIVQVAGGEKRSFAAQVQLMFGQSAEQKGKAEEAITHYREALRLDPDIVEAHNNLGNLLDAVGKPEEALIEYQAAVRLRPETPLVHENLGSQLMELGRFDEAMREYQEAARLAPGDSQPVYLMGKAWLGRGQSGEAVTAFQNALRMNPNDVQSMVYLARVLASDEAMQNRNGAQAVALAEQANTLTGGNQPFVLGTLAMAYAEAGRFEDARKTVQAALDLETSGGKSIASLQAQRKLYTANQPFRENFTNLLAK
jgi:Flp pilus assembly protein TadD